MQIEIRSDSITIDGYVNAVGRDSRPIRCQTGNFIEQVEPGVFGKALKKAKNVKLLLNHRNDRELGSVLQGNLTLAEDNIGLKAHAEVTDEEVIRKARSNQLTGWSFGMYVNECEMEERSNDIPRRKIKDIDIFEVSVIDNTLRPCYAGTSVECRAEGESSLLETRASENAFTAISAVSDEYFKEYEKKLAFYKAQAQWQRAEKRLAELRYNHCHNRKGEFCSNDEACSGGVDKSEKNGIMKSSTEISAVGANKFDKGFSKHNLDEHWGGSHDHSAEYPDFTKEQYAERALQLIQSEADGKNILGYKNESGQIARYDVKNNDYVIGRPSQGIATMFKPKRKSVYFHNRKQVEKGTTK